MTTAEVTRRPTEQSGPADSAERETYAPVVDIVETTDEIRVVADLPGVSGNDVDIHFDQGALTITGRVKPRQDEANTRWLLREYGVGDFTRSLRFRLDVNVEAIRAEMKDGVLTVHLPKAEALKPRRIPVQG
jgi:HSP20 family protein